jgi:hypothetical protein
MAIRCDEHASAKAHRVEDRLVLGDQRVSTKPRRAASFAPATCRSLSSLTLIT